MEQRTLEACGPGVTCFTKIKNLRNRGTILTLLGCAVQPSRAPRAARAKIKSRVMCPRGSEMAWFESDLNRERLELPASSWWIPRVSIFLGFLGVLIALV